ncbi:hypothetical protein [Lysobacter gummosus]
MGACSRIGALCLSRRDQASAAAALVIAAQGRGYCDVAPRER